MVRVQWYRQATTVSLLIQLTSSTNGIMHLDEFHRKTLARLQRLTKMEVEADHDQVKNNNDNLTSWKTVAKYSLRYVSFCQM